MFNRIKLFTDAGHTKIMNTLQTEETLIELGFIRNPEWDFEIKNNIGKIINIVPHYKLVVNDTMWRAYPQINNGTPYVTIGKVISKNKLVDAWIDCCSKGSVVRKLLLAKS